jgi:hypothetical protein
MRVLALADEAPPADAAEMVAQNNPDVVVTLGDLEPAYCASGSTGTAHAICCTGTRPRISRTQTHCLGVTEVTWVRGVALLELERT